jgi:serine/threonine-protein kinase PpkA
VHVYEIGEEQGKVYIAMEYLPGGSLADRLKDGPLSLEEAMKITREVGAGLASGHTKGMVHRDVKPGNILFNERGEAVIADFGLAKAMRKSSSYIQSSIGATVGTPYYRAPELWKGKPPPNPATDVYSLGCVVFEMLTGDVLFQGDTEEELITKHLLEDAQKLIANSQVRLPVQIKAVLARAPVERFPSMEAFVQGYSAQKQRAEPSHGQGETVKQRQKAVRDELYGALKKVPGWIYGALMGVAGVIGLGLVIGIMVSNLSGFKKMPDPDPTEESEVHATETAAAVQLTGQAESFTSTP